NCDLGFSVGTKEGKGSVLAHMREPHRKLVRQRDGSRHQLLILVTGVAKHHALVAGAAGVYAHGYVAGLFVDAGDYGAGVAVEAVEGVVVSDGLDGAADYEAGGGEGLAGYAAGGIFGEAGVEDGVGNLVCDLVGMAFGYGFGSK